MRRFIVALMLLAGGQALAGYVAATFTQNLTGSAPTLATDGASLNGASHFQVVVSAVEGQTLSGAGSLHCYYRSTKAARWMRCRSDFDITVNVAGVRDLPSRAFEAFPGGRIMYVPSGVTVSGGTTVDVTIEVGTR